MEPESPSPLFDGSLFQTYNKGFWSPLLTTDARHVLYRITAPAIANKHPATPPTTPGMEMPGTTSRSSVQLGADLARLRPLSVQLWMEGRGGEPNGINKRSADCASGNGARLLAQERLSAPGARRAARSPVDRR